MAPSLRLTLQRRDTGSSSPSVKTGSVTIPVIAIIGICISAVAVLIVITWILVRWYRKRQRRTREEGRESLFLTVKGVFKESSLGMKQTGFSRANMTASVVLPDKAIIRPDATPTEVHDYYAAQGTLPRPFAPFSFALNAPRLSSEHRRSSSSSRPSSTVLDKRVSTQSWSASAARMPSVFGGGSGRPSPGIPASGTSSPQRSFFTAESGDARDSIRDSFFGTGAGSAGGPNAARAASNSPFGFALAAGGARPSSGFTLAAQSRISVVSSFSQLSVGAGAGDGSISMQQRTVRQAFSPVLPDEPSLSIGERVTILRSFDDGWCIIARPLASSTLTAAGAGASATQDAELGAVPAWCFVKPLKGLRSERPVRSTSLGVTIQMDAPGSGAAGGGGIREEVMSWSNF